MLDQPRREAKIDVAGICTLTVGLVLTLLATSFGGSTWAWGSVEVITSYVVGTLFLVASGGFKEGYSETTLRGLSVLAAESCWPVRPGRARAPFRPSWPTDCTAITPSQ